MVIDKEDHLLFIEPQKIENAVQDEITGFMEKAMKKASVYGAHYKGIHLCVCGAESDSCNFTLDLAGKKYITNSLAAHYVKSHRSEVPPGELEKITNAMEKRNLLKNFFNFQ